MKRRNRLCRAALVLALLVLAAIVTGAAASATNTAIPEKLTGKWSQDNWGPLKVMVVGPRGKVNVTEAYTTTNGPRWYHTKFSHANVAAHRLTISGPRSCSGTGTYRWTIYQGRQWNALGWRLRLTKIHDACKARVNLFAPRNWDWGSNRDVN